MNESATHHICRLLRHVGAHHVAVLRCEVTHAIDLCATLISLFRNELVELSCDIINHVEGLEPQKHVIATHLLFLAKYLHPHTILTKLRLPNEFPEPAAVQMSKIIPLDLALGAPRPALNLFQLFTEFNHVSVSNNDFQAELQTRVKSSIASLTTLLTRGLRCQSLDSGSFCKSHCNMTRVKSSIVSLTHSQRTCSPSLPINCRSTVPC
jgi:hypothetical protein